MAEKTKAPTKGKRGRKALPADPREGFLTLVQGPTGRVQRTLDALETLGKTSNSTVPDPDGSGRIPVDYSDDDIDAIESAIMSQVEATFTRLRERPVSARAGKAGFTLG